MLKMGQPNVWVRNKWNWYFEYRAALLQVRYPKSSIEKTWGSKEITNASPIELRRYKIQTRITSVKRLVTRFQNAIDRYICEQKATLIPDFENKRYLRTIEKLEESKNELTDLTNQLLKLSWFESCLNIASKHNNEL